jgi:hypothetical protein
MTWTTPKTWATGEPLTASDLNTHVRDNLDALKTPPTDSFNGALNKNTTSTTFISIDAGLDLSITTSGGDVLVGLWIATLRVNGAGIGGAIRLLVDDAPVAYQYHVWGVSNGDRSFAGSYLAEGLAAGAHTFKLQWSVLTGGYTLTSPNVGWQFFAREV